MNKLLLLLAGAGLPLFFLPASVNAQQTSDRVVPVTVTTSANPPVISLSFPATPNTTSLRVGKKRSTQTAWTYKNLPTDATSWTDSVVVPGTGYEYKVERQTSTAPTLRYGLVYAGMELPPVEYRGKVILVVDDILTAPLALELSRFEQDLRGDGWQVIRHDINAAASSVPAVKALLRSDYLADSNRVVAAFLIGNIPVPYSGNIAPDGHGEHQGAWPTDYYYSDMTENVWTDFQIDNNTAARAANRNVPGDGKFDQSQTPSLPELVVSRVDFSNLSGWDVSQTELYRRYLNKNHAFRVGEFRPANKTLVDDNFGYFGGEAFAQSGWANGYALTGPASVVPADFFDGTENQSYLFGYGCGSGSYTGAAGVGSSANFITDTVNISFAMLFGSYHGDWDYETNPFMPSALASRGGILTCTWAGRPNWFFHHTGLGEPIWFSTFWAWFNSFIFPQPYPGNSNGSLVHVGLLGDPTLRLHAVKPPEAVMAKAACNAVQLSWSASAEAGVLGYAIYRAPAADSIFRLVTIVTDSLHYIDKAPLSGANFYQVKTFKLETTPTGSYYNQSIGVPVAVDMTPQPFSFIAAVGLISCNGAADGHITLSVTLGNPQNLKFLWSNGAVTQGITGLPAGTYTVTVTNTPGCTMTGSYMLSQPGPINRQAFAQHISCFGLSNGSINLTVNGGMPPYKFSWSNGASSQNIGNLSSGTYTVTITDNSGCTATTSAMVTAPTEITPILTPSPVLCNGASTGAITSTLNGGVPGYTYKWSNGATTASLTNLAAGTYTLTITDQNGCTKTATATVQQPAAISTTTAVTDASCTTAANGAIGLSVFGGTPGYTFLWSNGATTQPLNKVGSGVYTVTVTDLAGCTRTTTAIVGQTTTLAAQIATTHITCFGANNGSAMVTATGGDPGYTYLWSNGSTSAGIGGLAPGVYTATVTDNVGCTKTASATVGQPTALDASSKWNSANCTNIGTVTLTVDGGTPAYNFLWSTGATTQHLVNVPAAVYTVTITDKAGCTVTASNVIVQYPPLLASATVTPVSCFGGNDGRIDLLVAGGGAPYSFNWSNGAMTPGLQNLQSDFYSVTVSDGNGCTATASVFVSQAEELALSSSKTEVSCFGGSDGSLSIEASGGTMPYAYLWSTGATANPLSGLESGAYSVTLTDDKGCTATLINLQINEPPAVLGLYVPWQDIECPGQTTTLFIDTIFGGVGGPYTFSLDYGPLLPPDFPLSMAAGIHTITYFDKFGCSTTDTITVSTLPGPTIAGNDTACLNFPELYGLQGDFDSVVWLANNGGAITQGQGTGAATVFWPNLGLGTVSAIVGYGAGCLDTIENSVFVDICTGTREATLPGVRVLPNPFGSWLSVQFDRTVQPGTRWRLTDTGGRLIEEQTITNDHFRIDTGAWPAGVYFFQVVEKNRSGVWKMVKVE